LRENIKKKKKIIKNYKEKELKEKKLRRSEKVGYLCNRQAVGPFSTEQN
jgi:hypothetical protein